MTPERWREIDDLFDAARRIATAARDDWLRHACGGDDALRAEVGLLLAQDEGADRDGFLTPPDAPGPHLDQTASWHPVGDVTATADRPRPGSVGPIPRDKAHAVRAGFSPQGGDRGRRRRDAPSWSRRTWSGRGSASCRSFTS